MFHSTEKPECPGGYMGRLPGEHFWSIPHPVTGEQSCLWCNSKRMPETVDAEFRVIDPAPTDISNC